MLALMIGWGSQIWGGDMNLKLRCVTDDDLQKAREWRNEVRETLRTPYFISAFQQYEFFKSLQSPTSKMRYFSIDANFGNCDNYYTLVAVVGFAPISLENRNAEISIILSPEHRGKNIGEPCLALLLEEGFERINLENIYGEVYFCNPYLNFWDRFIRKYDLDTSVLPNRKYWDGHYFDSLYFNITRGEYLDKIKDNYNGRDGVSW